MPTRKSPVHILQEEALTIASNVLRVSVTDGFRRLSWCLLFLLIACCSSSAIAQELHSVSGTIYNPKDQQPLPGATAMVLSTDDSSMVAGTTTDFEGYFSVKELPSNDYILKVTYVGHSAMHKSFKVEGRSLGLGRMLLKSSSTQLQAVEVKATRSHLKQRGDTTVYFAAAVKVGYDASAKQLINKMPGMKARNGKLQAQGEDILEIMVDGKRFFEGDLETALKMLPAESVQNVEVYNYQNERSRLTGIDEGTDGKSINIVTKEAYRKSVFGRGYVGAGADGEYQGGGNVNMMNGDQRLTLLYQSNNINQQNFAQEDVSGISGSAMSEQSGVSKVHAGGVDFSHSFNEQTEVSGNYLFNANNNVSESELVRDYVPNSVGELQYFEDGDERSTSNSHNFNMRLKHELNDRNSLLFQPRLHINGHKSKRGFTSEMFQNEEKLSKSESTLATVGNGVDFSAPVNFAHQFKKRGRTFSVDFSPSYNKNSGESRLNSQWIMYNDIVDYDSLSQEGINTNESWSLAGGLHYSEPISKKSTLYFHWRSNMNVDESDERIYKDGVLTEEGSVPDSSLSNQFESKVFEHSFQPQYHFRTNNHHFKVGLEYSWSELNSKQIFPDNAEINREFTAWLPSASWRATLSKGKRLNLNYRTSNRAPSSFQLQTVPDNSNPMRQYAGNEQLDQEYRHSITANYYGNNFEKGSVFILGFNLSAVENFYGTTITTASADTVIDDRIFLQKGGQLMRTENMNGYIMLGVYTSIDHPINFLKSTLTTGLSLNQSRMPGMINGANNSANARSAELNVGINSNISKEIDFDFTTSSTYETVCYSLRRALNNSTFRQETNFSLRWVIWKGFTFSGDINHQMLRGDDEYFNRNILLCNLGLGYKFLRNKQAELRFTIFDLFNDNSSVRRTINEMYTDNYTNNVLNRYAMLTFTYRFKSGGNNHLD